VFTPEAVTTPLLTRYRAYLQHTLHCQPTSLNRALVSLKRYFAWTTTTHATSSNPTAVVKMVGYQTSAPRHLKDTE